jgi:hypothetical protein
MPVTPAFAEINENFFVLGAPIKESSRLRSNSLADHSVKLRFRTHL